ncbi:tigger transposable element-derived protein 2-like [Belonocnema kinseyi]|uniref:tigger transposable element-derived protein 2-like n=1 Tax=Belonocnema kinseyi TaxID=2817044 RepID=UPI00143DEE3F|nr:tigger transposable element-derived protein 2-like [Belonocnema kinseyi]
MCFADAHTIAKMPKIIKRKRLTFEEKYQLVREVKAGVPKKYLLEKYGISETMCRRVLAREADLNSKGESYEYQTKKSAKTSSDVLLDAAVLEWFMQARDRGDPVSGPIIQEKARVLDEKINGSQTFKASNGWLYGFNRRYGIRLKGEKSSNDPLGAAEFSPILKTKIQSENLNLDNIYNADESGFLWRLLTACTLHLHIDEEEALEREDCKDRITALFCANASGSHRIPLLLIGNSETPTCLNNLVTTNSEDQRFKNLDSLGVLYTHQAKAWIEKSIFLLWYKDVFIPRVLERQRQDAIAGKVLLLLDNAPCHSTLDELNAINENFEVLYLPPNVTASNQPMAQGIISTTKKLYKKELMRRLLLSEKSKGAVQFLKEFDLSDCFGMLSLAWDAVKSSSLKKAWKPLLTDSHLLARLEANLKLGQEEDPLFIDDAVLSELESSNDSMSISDEICDQVSELLSGADSSVEKTKEYLQNWFENRVGNDYIDCGWESLSDSDIVSLVTDRKREPENVTKIKNNENILKNPNSVNFLANSRRGSQIEKSETMLEDPVFVNFVTNGIYEPEIVPKVENSETMFENPDTASLVSNDIHGSKIVTEIEKSDNLLEDPVLASFVTNGTREPEIEESETVLDNSENMEITSSSEAFVHLMKFKNWAESRKDCLPQYLDCIKVLENWATDRKVCSWT